MRTVRHPVAVAALAIASLISVACGGAAEHRSSAAFGASRPASFTTADGVTLEGRIFGPDASADAAAGIVLAHMLPADQSSWFDEAVRLSQEGYVVVTFNLRGTCPGGDAGCSQGDPAPQAADVDLAAAVDHLHELGVQRIGLVGASVGGTAALRVAAADPSGVDAVITLSAPVTVAGLTAGPETVERVDAAKLFLAGTGDATAVAAAETFQGADGRGRLEVLASADHGTDLLSGSAGGRVRDLIDLWLLTYLPVTTASEPSP